MLFVLMPVGEDMRHIVILVTVMQNFCARQRNLPCWRNTAHKTLVKLEKLELSSTQRGCPGIPGYEDKGTHPNRPYGRDGHTLDGIRRVTSVLSTVHLVG